MSKFNLDWLAYQITGLWLLIAFIPGIGWGARIVAVYMALATMWGRAK